MTNKQLAEIRARAEAATPGKTEWAEGCDEEGNYTIFVKIGQDDDPYGGWLWMGAADSVHDTALFAHARSDVLALLAEIDRLRHMLGPS